MRDDLYHAIKPPRNKGVARAARVPLELEVQPLIERVHEVVGDRWVNLPSRYLVKNPNLEVAGRLIRRAIRLRALDGVPDGQDALYVAHAAHVGHERPARHLRHVVLRCHWAVEAAEVPEVRRLHERGVLLPELPRRSPDRLVSRRLRCVCARDGDDDRIDDDAYRRLDLAEARELGYLRVDVERLGVLEVVHVLCTRRLGLASCPSALHARKCASNVRQVGDRDTVCFARAEDASGVLRGPGFAGETRLEVAFSNNTIGNET